MVGHYKEDIKLKFQHPSRVLRVWPCLGTVFENGFMFFRTKKKKNTFDN